MRGDEKKWEAAWVEQPLSDGDVYRGHSVLLSEVGTPQQRQEHLIDIGVTADGALVLTRDGSYEDFIYFYPQQLIHLIKALLVATKQAGQAGSDLQVLGTPSEGTKL